MTSGSGITLNSYVTRPKSRGTVRLRSADPAAAPVVDPNFLAEPDDLRVSAEGVRISREIFRQPALRKFIKREHFPGDAVRTGAELEDYARAFGRMGAAVGHVMRPLDGFLAPIRHADLILAETHLPQFIHRRLSMLAVVKHPDRRGAKRSIDCHVRLLFDSW